MNGFNMKVLLLVIAVFVLGAATAVVQYAYGNEVIKANENMFMISHTEYRYGETGQIVVRLVDFQDQPIAVNNCTASILYPDKSFFVQGALMTATGNITGDHYYSFTTPNGPEGVYEYQATCNYNPAKTKTATNSFHLSSAFNTTISQLTELNATVVAFRSEVQQNFSQVQAAISSINVTADVAEIKVTLGQVNSTVNGINSNLNEFITNTTGYLVQINQTVVDNYALSVVINSTVASIWSDLLSINNTMTLRFDAIDLAISNGFTAMGSNFSQVFSNITDLRQLVYDINTSIINAINAVNLTPVLDAIYSVNSTLYNQINAVNLSISSNIDGFRQEVAANFSAVNDWLTLINTTTVTTYDYMTGTLANNINSILTTVGVINATVNRIETNVSKILENQENEVRMSVYSG